MDHGNPDIAGGGNVLIVSDEHITFIPETSVAVGDQIHVLPAHVDPTIAYHERMHMVRDGEVLETWEVDLRGW
jgi:D-serine deaminase-like pyridoxal phosphate-dependent protein